MMLRTLLPGIPQRYAFVGSAIGALLPFVSYSTEFLQSGGNLRIFERLGDPAHALLLAVPLLTGTMSYQYGRAIASLGTKLKARERAERHLVNLSQHDRLTGLPNRLALEKEIDRFIELQPQDDFRPALLLLDLDRFKHVNDTLGHDAGDELLRLFTDRLKQTLGPLVRLFRLGGDEFVVTLSGRPDERDIERLCRVIEATASEPFILKAGRALTGVSIGIAHIEATDHSMIDILKRADLALYIAKDIPGSSHAFHTEGLGRFMQAQMAFEHEMVLALDRGDFFLEYQPIVGAVDNDIQSFEALVRWRHAERGVLFPEHFLPMAARAGHIAAVGRWVVAQAIMDATSWPEHIGLAINASAEELRDPGFAAHIGDCLDSSGLLPSRLTIEITESTLAADIGTVGAGLVGLKDLGVRIALDDFGIGLSSINLLRQFPIDRLKIDRSFTHAMLDGGREGDLIDIIVKLGRAYNMPTTVEGVENERQMHMALSLGAAAVQGYLISQPVPAGAIQQLLVATSGMGEAKPEMRISA